MKKSLEERRVAHVKSLVTKCIEGNVPDLYNDYLFFVLSVVTFTAIILEITINFF